ncbi:DUF3263 domain-containing protein [Frondihabitans sucicola]|nr:DUF3263 domain-containing protein [Frondihabitans sucicola]
MREESLRPKFYAGERTEATPMNILAFEERWATNLDARRAVWRRNAIIAEFRMNPTRFQQLSLNALDDPEASAAYPHVVAAIRKRLAAASALRTAKTFRRAS